MLLVGAAAVAQQPYFYPSRGQSQAQQQQDRSTCYSWAVQQSGFDPSRAASAGTSAPPPATPPQGGAMRGATRGAAVGAVGGAIGGNAGKGAAIGAATGGLFGGMRRADEQRQQQYQAQQYQAQQNAAVIQGQAAYQHAFGACMQGHGYTVN